MKGPYGVVIPLTLLVVFGVMVGAGAGKDDRWSLPFCSMKCEMECLITRRPLCVSNCLKNCEEEKDMDAVSTCALSCANSSCKNFSSDASKQGCASSCYKRCAEN